MKSVILCRDLALVAALVFVCVESTSLLSSPFGAYCNPHGPWGSAISNGVMILIVIPVIVAGCIALFHSNARVVRIALILILAGGIGNLVSRVRFGCVFDIMFFERYPAFNIADVMLTFGGAILACVLLRNEKDASL